MTDEPNFVDEPDVDTEPMTAVDDLNELIATGQTLGGRYRLETQLAHRGTTTTWRAFDETLSRSVLIHILPPGDLRTDSVLAAARSAAVATDSRYLRVLDALEAGPAEPVSFVVCEFSLGESLQHILPDGPLGALSSAWLIRELADALAAMHSRGLFHRRLSPDTVIITTSGNVKMVGFLIDAALYPAPDEADQSFSELEGVDVQGLGRLLYACLTGLWPIDAHKRQITTWALPPAPRQADGRLVPPAQARSGVSPVLDAVCMQILEPSANSTALRTAREISNALTRVLGNAEATDDLERRVHQAAGASSRASRLGRQSPTEPAERTVVAAPVAPVQPGGVTLTMPAVTDEIQASQVSAPADQADELEPTADAQVDSDWEDDDADDDAPPPRTAGRSRPRWPWLLAALAVVIAVILAFQSCGGGSGTNGGNGGDNQPATEQVAIISARDFDPAADGGSGDENTDQTDHAYDGDPATSWRTVTYRNNAALGGLKPGVGLVLDLGSARTVTSISLTMDGEPTAVAFMVPAQDAGGDEPPMESVKQWTNAATNDAAPVDVTLTPAQPVSTRWVLIYLTKLPSIGGTDYRGGIAEMSVTAEV